MLQLLHTPVLSHDWHPSFWHWWKQCRLYWLEEKHLPIPSVVSRTNLAIEKQNIPNYNCYLLPMWLQSATCGPIHHWLHNSCRYVSQQHKDLGKHTNNTTGYLPFLLLHISGGGLWRSNMIHSSIREAENSVLLPHEEEFHIQITLYLTEEGHTTIQLASTKYSVIQRHGVNLTCAKVILHKDIMHKQFALSLRQSLCIL